ncbi:MAG: hypothetical protein ABJG41_01465 [Cyclobacteriaceae bacterium]
MKTSKKLLLFVIGLVMLNNVEHLAWVHYDLANKVFPELPFDWLNKLHSFIVVIIFEVVLVTFVREGKRGYSIFFTICIWVLSLIYYDASELIASSQWQNATAAAVYSTIFTISIFMFSEMLAELYQGENMVQILSTKIQQLQAELKESAHNLNERHAELAEVQAKFQESQSQLLKSQAEATSLASQVTKYQKAEESRKQDLTCEHCKTFVAESEANLRSHKGHCPDNPKNKK